jgi:hypothetical protein
MNGKKPSLCANFIEPWHSLWDATVQAFKTHEQPGHISQPRPMVDSGSADNVITPQDLNRNGTSLGWDVISCQYDENTVRQERLGISSSGKFGDAKRELEEKQLIRIFPIGRWRFLIPKIKLYETFGLKVDRELDNHTFCVKLGCHLLHKDPEVDRVQTEAKVGSSGVVDILLHLKNGEREAWEVTLSVGNVASNAAKLHNLGFSKIVFLCRNHHVQQGAWKNLKEAGLPPSLVARVRCILFSTILKKYRAIE